MRLERTSFWARLAREQAPGLLPRHLVLVANGDGRTHFAEDSHLVPKLSCLTTLLEAFHISHLTLVPVAVFSMKLSGAAQREALRQLTDELESLRELAEVESVHPRVVICTPLDDSPDDGMLSSLLQAAVAINKLTEDAAKKLIIYIHPRHSSLSTLLRASEILTSQSMTTESRPFSPEAVTRGLSLAVGLDKFYPPPPDLVLISSGEPRLGDIMLWETTLASCLILWRERALCLRPSSLRLWWIITRWQLFRMAARGPECPLRSKNRYQRPGIRRCIDTAESVSAVCAEDDDDGECSDASEASRGCFIYVTTPPSDAPGARQRLRK
ncbi:putative undecaprenyl diphosphate synthase [Giardia muris]|uniref:Putative undecaprenyl diphosphate synthase n=1 Tax=Giardia muris TaxID=5742 RepID=A0A4Z1SS27_GIAMU|nr:putative undecaprenyl diphosphate synthase [Giardia muris]|eukprot:TNJ28684.1 putative undecaprenyl diphosphate synthase [Giardia muris]